MIEKKLLWIEDEFSTVKNTARLMTQDLARAKVKLSIDYAKSKKAAMKQLANLDCYDLVILDLILPEGRDYTEQEYKKHEYTPATYVGLDLLEELENPLSAKKPIIVATIISESRPIAEVEKRLNSPGTNLIGFHLKTETGFHRNVLNSVRKVLLAECGQPSHS